MAGTTLVHWLSFMTGNATQLTNTNVYLVQPVNAPGQQYSFLNAVLIAWLMGLAYFLLTGAHLLAALYTVDGLLSNSWLPVFRMPVMCCWLPCLLPLLTGALPCEALMLSKPHTAKMRH